MRLLIMIVGVLLVLMGGLWVGQGMGWIMWPASSFMLLDTKWAYMGGATLVVGLLLIGFSRRR